MTRIRNGRAKIEFLANSLKIKELTEQGYSIILIYEHLKEEGKITMAYKTFCAVMKKYRDMEKNAERKLDMSHEKKENGQQQANHVTAPFGKGTGSLTHGNKF